jgi:hypothetical protein
MTHDQNEPRPEEAVSNPNPPREARTSILTSEFWLLNSSLPRHPEAQRGICFSMTHDQNEPRPEEAVSNPNPPREARTWILTSGF